MATFAKPENALKRAEELMNVGQKQAALQALHDLITSKRYRSWQKTLEKIMFKYVELCVDMRKGRFAKDGLIQYRIVCQQVNVSSLEEVIKYFMKLSTEKAEEAQNLAAADVTALDVKDLDEDKTPEDLMLSYVSGEKGKDRQERELVTPWFKFLWETYRTTLEILRNNSKLEALYAMTAHKAFQFCQQYKRTTEFRRLCEILRNHLANLNKYRDQRDRPDLTQPESLQLYLETRFEQLKVATELELWQEAFRSIEDIHGLMTLVKKTPKPQMMAVYYAKLTMIFWKSDNHLYHAYAWYKLYNLQKSYNKNLKEKDLQLMAGSVLLATLAVTPVDKKHGAAHYELEMEKDRSLRMASLLGFTVDPKRDNREVLSRTALLQEVLGNKGLMSNVPPEVKELYSLMETEFHPLDMAVKAQPLLAKLEGLSDKLSSASPVPEVQLEQYVPALEKLAALRLLNQVSQVYETLKLRNLAKMIPFGNMAFLEKLVVDAVKYNYVAMRLDHQHETVHFGCQDLEADKVRSHLVVLTKRLNKAVSMIQPAVAAPRQLKTRAPFQELQAAVEKEHQRLLARKILIERRKEEAEREIIEKEREEKTEKMKQQRLTEEAEAKRLQQEQARRLEERIRKELEDKELAEARALLEDRQKKDKKKGKKDKGEVDGKLDKQSLLQAALEEQMKEKQEMERKLQKTAKQMDHLERARREEERPLVDAMFQQRLQEDRVYHDQQQAALFEQSKQQHARDLEEKHRLSKMLADKEVFQGQVISRRQGEFERLQREREEKVAELREMRRTERTQLRKMELVKRREEAKLRQKMEEDLTKKRQEEERKRQEEEERRRKLDEIAAKQRQREAEAEEKAKKDREEALARTERARAEPPRAGRFVLPSLRNRSTGDAPPPATREPDRWDRDRERASEERPSAGGNKFVPSAARRGAGGEAPPPESAGGRFVPPGRRGGAEDPPREKEAASSGDKWAPFARRDDAARRPAVDRPAASERPVERGAGDRWGGRSEAPPAAVPESREREKRDGDAPATAPGAAPAAGKWRPSRMRAT